jgi:two-component system, OmpR family, KDP operon response regulator KdpE
MDAKQKILIIDDENQIRKILKVSLEASGYKIIEAETGNEGIISAATNHPNLIILDLGLPDKDGLIVLKEIREWSNIPILVLSVRNAEEDIITALNNGADDYLTKPFNTGELIARINAGLRRSSQIQESSVFVNDSVSIDLVSHLVTKNNEEIKLTATEYSLLVLFAKNISKVLTHRYILREVWGPSYIDQAQYLRVFVGQLRKKIEDDPANPKMIVTESGVGYRMVQLKQE